VLLGPAIFTNRFVVGVGTVRNAWTARRDGQCLVSRRVVADTVEATLGGRLLGLLNAAPTGGARGPPLGPTGRALAEIRHQIDATLDF
jgi:hypothetical protein